MFTLLFQEWGYYFAAVMICVMILATMTVCCVCLFLHLAYYLTGYYIRLLQYGLLSNSNSIVNPIKFVNGWVANENTFATNKTKTIYRRL